MKTSELSIGKKQPILTVKGKIRAIAQALGTANIIIWNVQKEATSRHWTGQPGKTTAIDDRNNVRAVENKKKTAVSDITNNFHSWTVRLSHSSAQRRLQVQKYRDHTTRWIRRPDWNTYYMNIHINVCEYLNLATPLSLLLSLTGCVGEPNVPQMWFLFSFVLPLSLTLLLAISQHEDHNIWKQDMLPFTVSH